MYALLKMGGIFHIFHPATVDGSEIRLTSWYVVAYPIIYTVLSIQQ